MTPAEYVEIVVLPTVREFLARPGYRRLAYLSAIATYHVVDYLMRTNAPSGNDPKARDARKAEIKRIEGIIAKTCPDEFAVVEGMCHGTKHCGMDREDVFRFTPGQEVPSKTFGFAEAGDTAGFGGTFATPRLVVHHNGRDIIVDEAVVRFLSVCQNEFGEHLSGSDLSGLYVRPH